MMQRPFFRVTACLTMAVWAGLFSLAVQAASIEGSWEGKLQGGGQTLRIVFHISSSDGSLKATLDSPDQGAYGIGVDTVTFVDNELRCEIKRISGVYEGKLNAADNTISGFWTQFGVPVVLALQPKVAVARNRPQEPKLPLPYLAEEISFENAKAGVKFAGTFTRPERGRKFTTVLLITGSGAQNRDEELMGHKPFLVLADYLTRRGIAVLRVDDRGVGGTTQGSGAATSEDFAQDARAAIDYLKSRKDVDKKNIGLIGHSEGGLIAPMVANQTKDVAYIALLAGPGVRGHDIVVKQSELMMEAQKLPPMLRANQLQLQQRLLDIAMQSPDEATALATFDKWWEERTKQSSDQFGASGSESEILKTMGDGLRAQLKNILSPWMRFFLAYDPAPALSKVRVPVLAINGTLDLQVPAAQNLPAIEAALKAGGNTAYTVQEFPGLNHLFQTAKTGSPTEYIDIEETMNHKVLDLVGNWIFENQK